MHSIRSIHETVNIPKCIVITGTVITVLMIALNDIPNLPSFATTGAFLGGIASGVVVLAIIGMYCCSKKQIQPKSNLRRYYRHERVGKNEFRCDEVQHKPNANAQSKSHALAELQLIDTLLREKRIPVGQRLIAPELTIDNLNQRNANIRELKERAQIIRDQFFYNSLQLRVFERLFGNVVRQENRIARLNDRIQNYSDRKGLLPQLPENLVYIVFAYFDVEEQRRLATIDRDAEKSYIISAQEFGYSGNDHAGARAFMQSLENQLRIFATSGRPLPVRVTIFQNVAYRVLDTPKTLRNVHKLTFGEIWDLLPIFDRTPDFEKFLLKSLKAYIQNGNAIVHNPRLTTSLNSKLLAAAARNQHIRVELLLLLGAQGNVRETRGGYTALELAAEVGNVRMARGLLNNNAQLNVGGISRPLLFAIRSKHIGMVRFLVEEGVSKRDALRYIAQTNNLELLRLIFGQGEDIREQINERDTNNAFLHALESVDRNKGPQHVAFIHELIRLGVNPNRIYQKNNLEWTPLMFAVSIQNHPGTVALLLHAELRIRDAIAANNQEALAEIFRTTADPRIPTSRNWTTLHSAASAGNLNVLNLCIALGMDVNAQCMPSLQTPLMSAFRSNSLNRCEVIKALLAAGARRDLRDSQDRIIYEDTPGWFRYDAYLVCIK